MTLVNIEKLGKRVSLNIAAEEDPADARLKRFKDCMMFIIATFFVVATFLFCGYIILHPSFSPDDQKWALTVDSGIISAFLGFITGKSLGKN